MVSEITSINPLTQARPVDDPEITKVQDLHTGKILDVKEFIARHRYDEFIATVRVPVREDFKKEVYLYACALCGTPVYVVASPDKRFFFRHAEEDGSCSARTRGTLSMQEIRARQYFGQRESEAHKRIKRLIERSLIVDRDFQTIALETVWRAARDLKARRQPDVQVESARFGRIAFEAQISNSFLDEIAGRRVFYRENGGLLVWVLGHFLPEYRRLAIEDILFTNNSNVFVVDEKRRVFPNSVTPFICAVSSVARSRDRRDHCRSMGRRNRRLRRSHPRCCNADRILFRLYGRRETPAGCYCVRRGSGTRGG